MCGRFNLIQSPLDLELMSRLGLADAQLRFNHDCAPCTPISIIRHVSDQLATQDAIWHLYLQQSGSGFKPHPKYWSINTMPSRWRSPVGSGAWIVFLFCWLRYIKVPIHIRAGNKVRIIYFLGIIIASFYIANGFCIPA